eukprot:scpid60702/ scgid28546/ 
MMSYASFGTSCQTPFLRSGWNQQNHLPFQLRLKGIPQGDGLSPVLFTVYLEAALRDLRSVLPPRPAADEHLPAETAYADDVDFISTSKAYLDQLLLLAESTFLPSPTTTTGHLSPNG